MEITFTLSGWSIILGFLIGAALLSFSLWLFERQENLDDRFHVGFSEGFDKGMEYKEIKEKEQLK